jgi:hypothetical protein
VGDICYFCSQGHGCRARRIAMDYQTLCSGPDERVPPNVELEGHACHARCSGMDDQTLCDGRDKRVPPRSGPDKQVPPNVELEGDACRAAETVAALCFRHILRNDVARLNQHG